MCHLLDETYNPEHFFFEQHRIVLGREWFRTERSAGTYSTFVYFVVTCIVHVPLVFVNNAIFSTFIFYMVGLGHTNGKHANWGHGYFYWILITFTFNMTGFAVAQLIASMSSSTAAAMSIWQPLMYRGFHQPLFLGLVHFFQLFRHH